RLLVGLLLVGLLLGRLVGLLVLALGSGLLFLLLGLGGLGRLRGLLSADAERNQNKGSQRSGNRADHGLSLGCWRRNAHRRSDVGSKRRARPPPFVTNPRKLCGTARSRGNRPQGRFSPMVQNSPALPRVGIHLPLSRHCACATTHPSQGAKNVPRINDADPVETREWLDAIESVIANEGVDRARLLPPPLL